MSRAFSFTACRGNDSEEAGWTLHGGRVKCKARLPPLNETFSANTPRWYWGCVCMLALIIGTIAPGVHMAVHSRGVTGSGPPPSSWHTDEHKKPCGTVPPTWRSSPRILLVSPGLHVSPFGRRFEVANYLFTYVTKICE